MSVPIALARSAYLSPGQTFKAAANLINGSSLLGVAIGVVGRAHLRRGPHGLILADGYRPRFPVAGAFTVGNVLLTGGSWPARVEQRPQLLAHEERHSWQYVLCGGLPFLPLYAAACGWSYLRTGDYASRNIFERAAGLVAGGYTEKPTRTVGWRAV